MSLFRKSTPAVDQQPASRTLSRPNDDEIAWMQSHLEAAALMKVDLDDVDQVARFYDSMLFHWTTPPEPERTDPNASINLVGTVFGEHLVRRTTLIWVVAKDSLSTELALHAAEGEVFVYPANLVAKRWVAGEDGSFIRSISAELDRFARHPGRHSA